MYEQICHEKYTILPRLCALLTGNRYHITYVLRSEKLYGSYCPLVRHWVYTNIFAVNVRFKICAQFWIPHSKLQKSCFLKFW